MRSWMSSSGGKAPPPSGSGAGSGLPNLPNLPGLPSLPGNNGSESKIASRYTNEAQQPLMQSSGSGSSYATRSGPGQASSIPNSASRRPVPPTIPPSSMMQQPSSPMGGNSVAPSSNMSNQSSSMSTGLVRTDGKKMYRVAESLTEAHARSNKLVVSPADFDDGSYVALKGTYMFTTLSDAQMPPGSVGLSRIQRQWVGASTGTSIDVTIFPLPGPEAVLMSVDLSVAFWSERMAVSTPFKSEDLAQVFKGNNREVMLSVGEPFVFDYEGMNLKAVVTSTTTPSGTGVPGIIASNTEVNFVKDHSSSIKVLSNSKKPPPNAILAPNFKFEDMGIGGLDNEFATIFRRAFASRIIPRDLLDRLGIQHVKGLLLYGPPGTGKTLMARQIGKMLNARPPKIVNGPEILSKFVGASEENVRNLFKEAEQEYKERGDDSELHILILDELDAVCKQRGSTNNGTGVGDSVVNQLLSKMDGVDQLNNLLIIGMTNRKDMIDEALLRPGRLEVHVEISLPDEQGRVQILNVHTSNMRANGALASDVNLNEIAVLTKNYSGAEISGLVKSAASYAYNRHIKIGTGVSVSGDINDVKVTRDDFLRALDDLEPAFGVNEDELGSTMPFGIIPYSTEISEILHEGSVLIKQATQSRSHNVSVVLHGLPGAGKSALASRIALDSGFPFIKRISAETLIGLPDVGKIAAIQKVFEDAYKSSFSCVVVDGIEDLIEWAPIGPRFSNGVLQALKLLIRKEPPKGRRILVLATTSNYEMLADLDFVDSFSTRIHVPSVNSLRRLEKVMRAVDLFQNDDDYTRALVTIEKMNIMGDGRVKIGVKRILNLIEMARQDSSSTMELFVSGLKDMV